MKTSKLLPQWGSQAGLERGMLLWCQVPVKTKAQVSHFMMWYYIFLYKEWDILRMAKSKEDKYGLSHSKSAAWVYSFISINHKPLKQYSLDIRDQSGEVWLWRTAVEEWWYGLIYAVTGPGYLAYIWDSCELSASYTSLKSNRTIVKLQMSSWSPELSVSGGTSCAETSA